ncbi:hypothetical protein ACFV00_15240 [Streptomyces californicus]|uniref:hypothetical protein n=1 Tax=Streptomyces californicus TaxID=67351 RepID=UPI0036998A29
MSEAQALVLQLRGMGMSNRAIGREMNRNDRLIGFVADGKKPAENLVEPLRALVAKRGGDTSVVVPTPERRKTKAGTDAKVRRKTQWAGGRTVRVKRQAVKAGAKAINNKLDQAAGAGKRVAFTVTFDRKAKLSKSDGTPLPPSGKEQTAEVGNRGNGFPAAWVAAEAGGDITGWVVNHLVETNRLAAPTDPIGLEMRVWDGRDDQAAGDEDAGMSMDP